MRNFVNERTVDCSHIELGEFGSMDAMNLAVAFDANKLGLRGEKVIFASTEKLGRAIQINLLTRTRTQRFLAWITRSL